MPANDLPPNPLFKLVVVVSAAFVLTILLMIVTALSSIESRLVRFFDGHGLKLIGVEVVLILGSSIAAMWIDGRRTTFRQINEVAENEPATDSGPEATASKRTEVSPSNDESCHTGEVHAPPVE
ncbi:MAG: hypothetical protein O3B86_14055 [Planctomycetota bacterium]|nr:hypothetical protein [Planctomycetota bacterium]